MANLNEKTKFIIGRNPLAKNNRPGFAQAEQTEAALWLVDGQVDGGRSGVAGYSAGISKGCIQNFKIESDKSELNALVIDGGKTVVMNPDISLSGPGCSDFTCKGTGILAEKEAVVDIRGGQIITHGATRAATIATTGATLKVFDANLETYGGPLPDWYKPVIGPGMMEPPYPLGLGGNCRTHLSMDNSETYFYNCRIYGEAWAALSTDSAGGYVYLEANDSDIIMKDNGYCIYSDNGCHVVLNHCDVSSGNVFGIQDGNSSVVFRDVNGQCQGYGFLIHGGMHDLEDIGTIRMKDCDLTSKGPMFRCKSTNVDMYLKNCRITGTDGVILETMLTDDAHYYQTRTHSEDEYGVQVTMEEMELFGDFNCLDPERKTCLNLVDTAITGGIAGYPQLRLTEGSTFTATKDSQITLIGSAEGLDAAAGVTITAKGQGEDASLPSGGVLKFI